MLNFLKKITPFLILTSFIILSALLPEILGKYIQELLQKYFGEIYKYILIAFFLLLFLFAAYINPEIRIGLFPKRGKGISEQYSLSGTEKNRQLLVKAKKAVSEANPVEALKYLSEFNIPTLDIEISNLGARLAQLRRTEMHGTVYTQAESRALNRISVDLLDLIEALEREIEEPFAFYDKIRVALSSRYQIRLNQKLSNRQPINLRLLPSTTGTSQYAAANFVQYNKEEDSKKLAEYFEDSNGRLLLLGAPGAGKTTLLLQLALELLNKDMDQIPVILNLATWNKTLSTLESWVQKILPLELGISEKIATNLITQNKLILLLDGLDEINIKDRLICLEAIGEYGAYPNRKFIISCRSNEYNIIQKNAPVNNQVEVKGLTYEQLIEQLENFNSNEGSLRLLYALKADVLLREIAEIPFYFNTLQLMFARGKYLHEFNFSALDPEGRKKEIEDSFVYEMLYKMENKGYQIKIVIKYLVFFASRIKRANLIDFELAHLQYNWYNLTKWDYIIGNGIEGLVFGLYLGLIYGLFFGPVVGIFFFSFFGLANSLIIGLLVGLFLGLFFGLFVGLVYCVYESQNGKHFPIIEVVDHKSWKWWAPQFSFNKSFWGYDKILGLIFGLLVWLIYSQIFGLLIGLLGGMIVFFAGSLMGALFRKLVSEIVEKWTNPLNKYNNSYVQISTPYQRFSTSAKMLYFSILQYRHLLHLLNKKDLLPIKLVDFLNNMVECNILITTGTSWRFKDYSLQEYFASRWEELENGKNN